MCPTRRSNAADHSEVKLPRIGYHPEAVDDLEYTTTYYEERQPGLGRRFVEIYEETISHIRNNPTTWKQDESGRYFIGLRRFPFIVIYRIYDSNIYIIAVASTSKKPGYWLYRDTE